VGQAVPQARRADARPLLLPVPPAPRALRLARLGLVVVAHHHAAETEPPTSSPTGPDGNATTTTTASSRVKKPSSHLSPCGCGGARVLRYI